MDKDARKTALRMIPYGLYVLTAETAEGKVAAATVNWVTQTSFEPPLIAVAVKTDSGAYDVVTQSGAFALNMLGKGQQKAAFAFFKPAAREGDTIAGERIKDGETGSPLLLSAPASIECRVRDVARLGDHHVVLGEVVAATVRTPPEGRPDDAILHMKDLGDTVFYGG